jgi:hypothetical protein
MIDRAIIVRQPVPPPTGRTWTLRLDTTPRYPGSSRGSPPGSAGVADSPLS